MIFISWYFARWTLQVRLQQCITKLVSESSTELWDVWTYTICIHWIFNFCKKTWCHGASKGPKHTKLVLAMINCSAQMESAHGWIASRNWIEKGTRTLAYHGNVFPSSEEDEDTEGRAASPHPSGDDAAAMDLVATDPVKLDPWGYTCWCKHSRLEQGTNRSAKRNWKNLQHMEPRYKVMLV